MYCIADVKDTRKEPPNPREPIELPDNDISEKRSINFTQQHAAALAATVLPAAQVHFPPDLQPI